MRVNLRNFHAMIRRIDGKFVKLSHYKEGEIIEFTENSWNWLCKEVKISRWIDGKFVKVAKIKRGIFLNHWIHGKIIEKNFVNLTWWVFRYFPNYMFSIQCSTRVRCGLPCIACTTYLKTFLLLYVYVYVIRNKSLLRLCSPAAKIFKKF